ncbi:hypothetical protein [Streptomyces sp. NPDC058672]|uniref:hypothetical protein n=1 Tax=Streptomyces sp. NPDC058672 TaxID=3346591 RepID=UPI003657A64A
MASMTTVRRAEQAYAEQLAHLEACAACRQERHCEVGTRIRRAVSAARAAAAARPSDGEDS